MLVGRWQASVGFKFFKGLPTVGSWSELRLMDKFLHDPTLTYLNPGNYGRILYLGSCRIFVHQQYGSKLGAERFRTWGSA